MDRIAYPLSHEWHVAINRYINNTNWPANRFMYDAEKMADEIPRMAILFKLDRENALPTTHQQCSHSPVVTLPKNELACCMGVKCRQCPMLLALDKIERVTPADIDTAKAWTCAAHIVSMGGDHANEGFILTTGDRVFWDHVYESLSQSEQSL